MKKILYNIDIWFSCLVAMIKSMMEYRTDFLVGLFSQVAMQLTELIFLWIVFQGTQDIAGWNFYQLLLLYGVMMFALSVVDLLFDSLYDLGPNYIREGVFDIILLRPVHPLISIMGQSRSINSVGYLVLSLGLIIITLIKLEIAITFGLIFSIVFFGFVGGFILGGIITLLSVASFWTFKSNEIMWSAFKLYTISTYPIEIYNKVIRILITFVFPFVFVAYYPTLNYLNMNMGYLIFLSPIVAIVLWIVSIKIWNLGLNFYRSTGS
jgi:ABC-2 type transport system permease protein